MKTLEQNKKDVINYLRLTSQHRFLRGTETMTIVETESGEWFEIKNGTPSKYPINIEWQVSNYGNDAKNVIKNMIFPKDHGYVSIRRKYYDKLLK